MGTTRLEFYAVPAEQRVWLSALTTDPLLWLVVDSFPGSGAALATATVLQELTFQGPGQLQVFLGRKDLGPGPQWRIAGRRKELDFTASQAIQFVPSMVERDVLVEGRLAIMHRSDYERDGIAFEPLRNWFREIGGSLKTGLKTQQMRLITYSATEAPAPSARKVLVSPGAIVWRRSGKRLQQVAGSLIEFDIPADSITS